MIHRQYPGETYWLPAAQEKTCQAGKAVKWSSSPAGVGRAGITALPSCIQPLPSAAKSSPASHFGFPFTEGSGCRIGGGAAILSPPCIGGPCHYGKARNGSHSLQQLHSCRAAWAGFALASPRLPHSVFLPCLPIHLPGGFFLQDNGGRTWKPLSVKVPLH